MVKKWRSEEGQNIEAVGVELVKDEKDKPQLNLEKNQLVSWWGSYCLFIVIEGNC